MSKSDAEKVVAEATNIGPEIIDYDSDAYEDASEEHGVAQVYILHDVPDFCPKDNFGT